MIYVFESYSLDPERRELRRGEDVVSLEPRVFDLLKFLVTNRDRVVTKDDLISNVWDGRIVSDSALTSRINAARQAVADNGDQQRLIRTVARKGYRFVGQVQEKENEATVLQSRGKNTISLVPASKQTITFCKTSDGVSLAVASTGDGPTLVRVTSLATHLEYDWQYPVLGPLFQHLSNSRRLVRFDGRGNGLSDRDIESISLQTFVTDLEAVIECLKLRRFVLFAMSGGAATAITYAIRHPDRVSKLIIFGGYARGRNKRNNPQRIEEAKAFLTMLRSGWPDPLSPFWRIFNSLFLPNSSPEQFKWLMDYHRTAASAEASNMLRVAVDNIDVLGLLPKVQIPTIVFHCLRDNLVPFDEGRLLAASILNSKFVALDSDNHLLLPDEPAWSEFIAEIDAFLADDI